MALPACVTIFSFGQRSNRPAKTMRDMATRVSQGQPKATSSGNGLDAGVGTDVYR
jgi:hypothetical protein